MLGVMIVFGGWSIY